MKSLASKTDLKPQLSGVGRLIIDPSKVRDAMLQGVQNYWDERAAIAITHTNYYKEW